MELNMHLQYLCSFKLKRKAFAKEMNSLTYKILSFTSLFLLLITSTNSSSIPDAFIQCLSDHFPSSTSILNTVYTPSNSSYQSLWETPGQNLRFLTATTPKPLLIICPFVYSHVQATVICCRLHGLQVRIRSGGHDYEGLSYTSNYAPFLMLDLQNLRSVEVQLDDNSSWVESGVTLGELYYWIAQKSPVHGFPAGTCPTVGVGGHLSGGGFGTLLRKYGAASDNVIDALIVDVNGRILDRKSMGEDLFWAIRGGGGSSFGVILAWKVNIVDVPPVVTVFNLPKTLEQGATALVHKWQYIGATLNEDLFLRLIIRSVGDGKNRTVRAAFNSLYLGTIDQLLKIMEENFPELGLTPEDCTEMSWIESVLYFAWYPNGITVDDLKNRTPEPKTYFKATSDFVEEPLSYAALEEVWKWCLEEDHEIILIFDPFGGRMKDISERETAFPHRKGNLYNIQYMLKWKEGENGERRINSMRRLYNNMTPYVSKEPRAAYFNFRDLDFGVNAVNGSTFVEALPWGVRYFKHNFKRLAIVKGMVDPDNFFRDEQSIPPLILDEGKEAI